MVNPKKRVERQNKLLLKAFYITLICLPVEAILILLAGHMPDSLSQNALLIVAMIPLAPALAIMDQIFPGPSHDAVGLVMMIVLGFMSFMVCVWLILIAYDALRRKRRTLSQR
jgi:predicted permease